jgi:hypothetical protein
LLSAHDDEAEQGKESRKATRVAFRTIDDSSSP